jgi:hypothetical protein
MRRIIDAALDDVSCCANHQTQTSVAVKEREPMPTLVLIGPAFASAGDPAVPHQALNESRPDTEAFCDQRCIDTERLTVKLYLVGHCQGCS